MTSHRAVEKYLQSGLVGKHPWGFGPHISSGFPGPCSLAVAQVLPDAVQKRVRKMLQYLMVNVEAKKSLPPPQQHQSQHAVSFSVSFYVQGTFYLFFALAVLGTLVHVELGF